MKLILKQRTISPAEPLHSSNHHQPPKASYPLDIWGYINQIIVVFRNSIFGTINERRKKRLPLNHGDFTKNYLIRAMDNFYLNCILIPIDTGLQQHQDPHIYEHSQKQMSEVQFPILDPSFYSSKHNHDFFIFYFIKIIPNK